MGFNRNSGRRLFLPRRRGARGFTLIEMIVATILLFVGVVSTVMCISAAAKSTSIASEYTTAALLAQQRLAEIEAGADQISAGEQQGQFDGSYSNFHWQQNIETDNTNPVYKVSLLVQWPSGIQMRQAQFVTFIMAPSTSTGTTAN